MYIKTQDLVLRVTRDIDPQKLDLSKYDDFLDELCGHREFQKEAIRIVVKFLLGGEYEDTADLAKENFETNPGHFKSIMGSLRILEPNLGFLINFPVLLTLPLQQAKPG